MRALTKGNIIPLGFEGEYWPDEMTELFTDGCIIPLSSGGSIIVIRDYLALGEYAVINENECYRTNDILMATCFVQDIINKVQRRLTCSP